MVVKKFKAGVIFETRTYYSRIATFIGKTKPPASELKRLILGNLYDPVNFALEKDAEYDWHITQENIVEYGSTCTIFRVKLVKLTDKDAVIKKAEKEAAKKAKQEAENAKFREKEALKKAGKLRTVWYTSYGPGGSQSDWSVDEVLVSGKWIPYK